MLQKLIVVTFFIAAATSGAVANTIVSSSASQIVKITAGHGMPGDTATSKSNPEISVRVLENGWVERTNKHFGTSAIFNPASDARRRLR